MGLLEFRIKNLELRIKLFFALFFILIALFLPTTVSAQTSPVPANVSPTSPIYTDLLVHNLFHSFSCLAIGSSVIGQPCLTYQLAQNAQGAIQGVPVLSSANLSGGLLGTTTGLIAGLYINPPVRTVDYLASVGEGLGVVKPAHAQVVGSGAAVLNPILTLWQVSRNISYVVMIIIFVIIGLMVMFRTRINPQTVITAQAALPGLVIGLIMITFSYFLAGLVSDMAFVGTNLVGAYFSAVRGQTDNPQNLVQDVQSESILKIFTPFTKIISQDKVYNALSSIWNDLADPGTCRFCPWEMDPQKAISSLASFIVLQFVMPFGSMFGGIGQVIAGGASLVGTGLLPEFMVSLALSFIAMLILIYAMFMLLLRLINNYISIIFLTITAPFQFLAAALPGRQGTATRWILGMLANVLAFPAVLAVLYFVAFILGRDFGPLKVTDASSINSGFVPVVSAAEPIQIAGNATFPLFGGLDLGFINLLLAFGALVALPKVPDLVAKAVGGLSEAGQLLGQEIGSSVGAGRGYAGQFQQGTSGLAGQVGNLRDQPGYLYLGDGKWQKITAGTPGILANDAFLSGYRPGLVRRIGSGLSGLLGRNKPGS